jgi:1-acyl-sn-glycerol-3-phosphate acyltransferase
MRGLMKLITLLTLRAEVRGLENFPTHGPAILVFNHLGDADVVLMMAALPPRTAEGMGKIELNDHWLVGPVFRAYGIIWVHRGRPDRRALRAALDALAEGRMVVLAPEGRQTLTGGLEEGNEGTAFLALRSGAPVVPIALTGTENQRVYSHMKRWKRAPVTLTVGKILLLEEQANHRESLRESTRRIMQAVASLLPEAYRGQYRTNPPDSQ